MIESARFKMELKVCPMFHCKRCEGQQAGDTMSVEIEGCDIGEIPARLQRIELQARYMPVGWSSYYAPDRDYFLCGYCAAS